MKHRQRRRVTLTSGGIKPNRKHKSSGTGSKQSTTAKQKKPPAPSVLKKRRKQLRCDLVASLRIPATDLVPNKPAIITSTDIRIQVWLRRDGERVLNSQGQPMTQVRHIPVGTLVGVQRDLFTKLRALTRP